MVVKMANGQDWLATFLFSGRRVLIPRLESSENLDKLRGRVSAFHVVDAPLLVEAESKRGNVGRETFGHGGR